MSNSKGKAIAQLLTLTTLLPENSSYFNTLIKKGMSNEVYCRTCIVGRQTPEECEKCDRYRV